MGEHLRVPLTRIHLEEDVGKLNHAGNESLIDFNRAGTPLMEIVSEPAIRSAEEAFAYLTALKTIMVYGGISDCDMEKGQMRCDANVSIRPAGETKLGTKVELKNLNSISFVRDGIAHEIKRQIAVVASGGAIAQETRDYDGQTGTSQSLRSKEMAHDYRYFPDPDFDAGEGRRGMEGCNPRRMPGTAVRQAAPVFRRVPAAVHDFVGAHARPGTFAITLSRLRSSQAGRRPRENWIANDLLRELRGRQDGARRLQGASGACRRADQARRRRGDLQQHCQGGVC